MTKREGSRTAGCSARLNKLLDAAGLPAAGHGRLSEFARRFDVGKANAKRWLECDVLPRDMEELHRIASGLGSSAAWWAYGEGAHAGAAPEPDDHLDFVLVGRCVNAVLLYLDEQVGNALSIDDDILVAAYGELYRDARANGGHINQQLVAQVALRVLADQHRKGGTPQNGSA